MDVGRLSPMAKWLDRQMNTPWSSGLSDEFKRGYDTAVEEASAAYDSELALWASTSGDGDSIEVRRVRRPEGMLLVVGPFQPFEVSDGD